MKRTLERPTPPRACIDKNPVMTTQEDTHEYFDSLCELDNYSQENFEYLQTVLSELKELVNSSDSSDNDVIKQLEQLSRDYKALVESSVNLRYSKYQTREAQIQSHEKMESDNHVRLSRSPFNEDVREYVTVMENIQRESLEYSNLVERLSVDLVRQVEVADPEVTSVDMDDWKPTKDLQAILDDYCKENKEDLYSINHKVKDYLDEIKLARAKHTLENKYNLQDKMSRLNSEVSRWRKEWDSMETLMFGNDPRSMRSMLHTIETLKSSLIENDKKEEDVVME